MWRLLQRNQECVLVGAAISLAVLAWLGHGSPVSKVPGQTDCATKTASGLRGSPRDPAFYASQWRQIANEFYDTHPVEPAKKSTPVIAASHHVSPDAAFLRPQLGLRKTEPTALAAGHVEFEDSAARPSEVRASAYGSRAQPLLVGPLAVAASLAAGIVACLLYHLIWPTVPIAPKNSVTLADTLRIELPSEWVHLRPSFRHRFRPLVLSASYLTAAIATWFVFVI